MKINNINQFIEAARLNTNVKDAIVANFKYKELKEIVRKNEIEKLLELKGVSPKTAAKIIKEFKTWRKEVNSSVEVLNKGYTAFMYNLSNCFDKEELSYITTINSSDNADDIITALNKIVGYNAGPYNKPYVAKGIPERTTLPRSMLSDLLNINGGDTSASICLFKHNIDGYFRLPYELLAKFSSNKAKIIRESAEAARESIMQRLVYAGFQTETGKKYDYFASSPSQLKKGSAYFLATEEAVHLKKIFWGGVTPQFINQQLGKKGIAMTKFLQQFRTLLTSSAVPSSEVFGAPLTIDQFVCEGEYEKAMSADVMSVSDNYKVSEGHRDDIMNNMFDGEFFIFYDRLKAYLERVTGKEVSYNLFRCMQMRGYSIKGLGVVVDLKRYCCEQGYDKNPDCYKIKTLDGVVDLGKNKNIIGVINTSVFKLSKVYKTWQFYVETMKKLGLTELYICAIDEKERPNKQLARQATQSLFAADEAELDYMSERSIKRLNKFNDLEEATKIIAQDGDDYENKSNLAKLVSAYPEIMKLDCVQKELRDRYVKEYDSAMCGELKVNGNYRFAAADPYAWIDIVFGKKKVDDPTIGLLKANEVRCNQFKDAKELIALRFPHCFMEWVVANQAEKNAFMHNDCIFFSVHDLNFRVLQMDFDGDHVLVIDDEWMVEIVKRIKREYEVPTLYYEPTTADNVDPLPTGEDAKWEFAKLITTCIMKCLDTNKVGQYSNLATYAWSLVNKGAPKEEMHEHFKTIAVIAAAINHAVDAQKTYKLNKLSYEFVEQYKKKPFNQRFKDANPEMPHDNSGWNGLTEPKGEGSVDRLGDIISEQIGDHLDIDTSSLNFDWRLMESHDVTFKQIKSITLSEKLIKLVESFGKSKNEKDARILADARKGKSVQFADFMNILRRQNAAFWKAYKEDDTNDDDVITKALMERERYALIRKLVIYFIKKSNANLAELSNEDVLKIASISMLKNTFTYESKIGQARFIIDVFGDIYAEAVRKNRAANYQPASDDESDYEEAPFDVNLMDCPPETEDIPTLDQIVFENPQDDLI